MCLRGQLVGRNSDLLSAYFFGPLLYADVPEQGASTQYRLQGTVQHDERRDAVGDHDVVTVRAMYPFDVHDKRLFRVLLDFDGCI